VTEGSRRPGRGSSYAGRRSSTRTAFPSLRGTRPGSTTTTGMRSPVSSCRRRSATARSASWSAPGWGSHSGRGGPPGIRRRRSHPVVDPVARQPDTPPPHRSATVESSRSPHVPSAPASSHFRTPVRITARPFASRPRDRDHHRGFQSARHPVDRPATWNTRGAVKARRPQSRPSARDVEPPSAGPTTGGSPTRSTRTSVRKRWGGNGGGLAMLSGQCGVV
jgi:hypothetical protein